MKFSGWLGLSAYVLLPGLLLVWPAEVAYPRQQATSVSLEQRFSRYEQAIDKLARNYTDEPLQALLQLSTISPQPSTIPDRALNLVYRCLLTSRLKKVDDFAALIAEFDVLEKSAHSPGTSNALHAARYLCLSLQAQSPSSSELALANAYHDVRQADGAVLRYWISTSYAAMTALHGRARAAMEAHKLALGIARANHDDLRLSESLRTLAGVEVDFGNKQDALLHIDEAIQIVQRANLPKAELDFLLTKGFILLSLKRYDESWTVYHRAEQFAIEQKANDVFPVIWGNYADLSYHQGNFKRANDYVQKVLTIARQENDPMLMAYTKATMGLLAVRAQQDKQAESYLSEASSLFREANRLVDLRDLYGNQAQAYAAMDEFKKAYLALQNKQKLIEEIEQESQGHDAAEAGQLLELEHKEKENLRLHEIAYASQLAEQQANVRAQRYWIAILGSAICLVLAVQLLWYLKRRNTQLLDQNLLLDRQRYLDGLTGLFNRLYYQDKLAELSKRIAQAVAQQRQFVVFILDVDFFKQVNDNYGHDAGDAALKEVTRRLQLSVRERDIVLRWGGEEFVVFSELPVDSDASLLAERLRTEIAQQDWYYQQKKIALRVSIGYACLPLYWRDGAALTLEMALKLADAALYLAKRKGRNRSIGVTAIRQQNLSCEQILADLEAAWASQQVQLLAKPETLLSSDESLAGLA